MTQSIAITIAPSNVSFTQIFNERRFTAQSGAAKFAARGGNRWAMTAQWLNLTGTRLHTLAGQILELDGGLNRAVITPSTMHHYVRRGTGGGNPQLNTAEAAGATALHFDGATASVTGYLKANDWITIANELHRVKADMNTNGSGVGIVEIWPALFQAQADNSALVIASASVYGIFVQTAPVSWPLSPYSATDAIVDSITLSLEQDILG